MKIEEIVKMVVGIIKETESEAKETPSEEEKGESSGDADGKKQATDGNDDSPENKQAPHITEDSIKAAVKQVLAENAPAVGAPSNGGDALTIDAIKGMNEKEINSRWEEVSKVLADSKKGA